jgi:hypothetical protein
VSNGPGRAFGIQALAAGGNSPVDIVNSGDITATAAGSDYYSLARGIYAATVNAGSPISIRDSGNIFASGLYSTGVFALSRSSDIVIVNTGSISASSFRAIDTYGGSTDIFNTGRITGFVDLTDNNDRFFNQAGGVFETKLVSNFGLGNDLFRNEAGGTVQAATDPGARERSSFVIGSLWGNLSGDNQATLVSSGTTFRFEDDLDDVWGEVSAGVNFFNPLASTSVFAKLDVTFGDDVEGIGGKAGMRVSW